MKAIMLMINTKKMIDLLNIKVEFHMFQLSKCFDMIANCQKMFYVYLEMICIYTFGKGYA